MHVDPEGKSLAGEQIHSNILVGPIGLLKIIGLCHLNILSSFMELTNVKTFTRENRKRKIEKTIRPARYPQLAPFTPLQLNPDSCGQRTCARRRGPGALSTWSAQNSPKRCSVPIELFIYCIFFHYLTDYIIGVPSRGVVRHQTLLWHRPLSYIPCFLPSVLCTPCTTWLQKHPLQQSLHPLCNSSGRKFDISIGRDINSYCQHALMFACIWTQILFYELNVILFLF